MYDFLNCKICKKTSVKNKYSISNNTNILECGSCGFHCIDYLDELDNASETTEPANLTEQEFNYIDKQLQSNKERFVSKVDKISENITLQGAKCLDVGAGGGLFLHLLKEKGAEVYGIEPNIIRRLFAEKKYQITLNPNIIDKTYWKENFKNKFDVICLWDVIEHVNFPLETLEDVYKLLKPGGILYLDTPARDAFYYRVGELTYKLTNGRFPSFLNIMYSNSKYAHKQIFTTSELEKILRDIGFDVIYCKKLHELSFPYAFYLKKIVKSENIAKILVPPVKVFLKIFRIENKMLTIAKKNR